PAPLAWSALTHFSGRSNFPTILIAAAVGQTSFPVPRSHRGRIASGLRLDFRAWPGRRLVWEQLRLAVPARGLPGRAGRLVLAAAPLADSHRALDHRTDNLPDSQVWRRQRPGDGAGTARVQPRQLRGLA